MTTPLLQLDRVTIRFGGLTAVSELNLGIGSNELIGLIGPNGAGKTTLFNVICGFVKPDSGSLIWRGQEVTGIRPDRLVSLDIARTLQGVGLFPRMTVLENVMVGSQRFRKAGIASALLGLPRSDRDERALRGRALSALQGLDCGDIGDRLPATLPYAVQKRVALARALASEPELLLLDEPAGGLDPGELSELTATIRSFGSSIAVMLVDHHMDFVTSVCDRVIVLDFGRVIASGVPPVVRQDPRVLEAYLGREVEQAQTAPATGTGDAHS